MLAQCKAETKKMGPAYLRELEGVVYKHLASTHACLPHILHSSPSPQDGFARTEEQLAQPIIALLISQSAFTRACMLAAHSSPVPLLLLHLPAGRDAELGGSAIGSAVWNQALGSCRGVLGGDMEMRWERDEGVGGGPGLWWRGSRLESWTPSESS